ncbi:MAG: hypothetical protein OYG31_01905 [Candidatus Kaiserbacteria bacterium]|nr:hypothetical protein [Candidatus Kaiserbacteria bacterium]
MDMHVTSPTGLFLRFPEGGVGINPGDDKRADTASLLLNTFPVPVSGWSGVFVSNKEGQQVFSGAGEFECNGLQVHGYGSETTVDSAPVQTTSWLINGDGMRVLVLGAISDGSSAQQALAGVDAVDVLVVFCPASGGHLKAGDITDLVAAKQAVKVVLTGDDSDLLKNMGKELGDPIHVAGKHSIKKKDIAGEGAQVIILE